jgi:hypothetical protein
MNEVVAQAAAGMSTEDAQALEVLRLLWGDEYSVGYDDDHGWWAARNGVAGHILEAPGAEMLGTMMADDFGPRQ